MAFTCVLLQEFDGVGFGAFIKVYTDDLKEGGTRSIGELSIRVVEQLFLADNMTID